MRLSLITRTKYKGFALLKWCLSFRKAGWDISDYPVIVRAAGAADHWKASPFAAFIVNWGLMGTGNTSAEAAQSLRDTFENVKRERLRNGQELPRPGTVVPMQFASTERVDAYPELADDFIRRVLDLDWAFISDELSLWDFNDGESNAALCAKIHQIYRVDVTDIESARLCEIFERISALRKQV